MNGGHEAPVVEGFTFVILSHQLLEEVYIHSMAPLPSPPQCVSKLVTRSDDTEAVVKERLRIYNEKSQPLEDFYRNQAKLLEFDLPGGIPESWPKLLEALNLLDYHEEKQSAAA
ncbi:hypothetical protein CsSME_00017129 [Camellia sinensis var. sinensis]